MMVKITITLCLLATSLASFGQDNVLKWGFELTPNISASRTTYDDPSFEGSFKSIEKSKVSFSTHVFMQYALSQRLKISLGLGFQNTGYRTVQNDLSFFKADSLDIGGNAKTRYIVNYAQVPLDLTYYVTSRFYAQAGGSVNFYVNNSRKSYIKIDGKENRSVMQDNHTEYRDVNGTISLGLGYDIFELHRSEIYIQPEGSYQIGGLTKSTPINRNMWSVGLSVGSRF